MLPVTTSYARAAQMSWQVSGLRFQVTSPSTPHRPDVQPVGFRVVEIVAGVEVYDPRDVRDADFAEVEGKRGQWSAFLERNQIVVVAESLDAVVDSIAVFLGPALGGARSEDAF